MRNALLVCLGSLSIVVAGGTKALSDGKTVVFEGLKIITEEKATCKVSSSTYGKHKVSAFRLTKDVSGEAVIIEINVTPRKVSDPDKELRDHVQLMKSISGDERLLPGGKKTLYASYFQFLGMASYKESYEVTQEKNGLKKRMRADSITCIGNDRAYLFTCSYPTRIGKQASNIWFRFVNGISVAKL